MKIRKFIKQMYKAILEHKINKEVKLYKKITKKSLKHKHTEVVQ